MKKLISTSKILFNLGMARTFGQYKHSVYDGKLNYAVYKWQNQFWAIPTTPMENEN